jgi:LPXTG-motif cell wall-anchored protein
VKLSVKKLRRSATVIGGTFLGLGVAAAMATPALACHTLITPTSSCVNADGSWEVHWTVSPSDGNQVTGHVTKVVDSPVGSLTGIVGDNGDEPGSKLPADGVQKLPKDVDHASITVTAVFDIGHNFVDTKAGDADKPTQKCDTTPPTNPKPPTKPKPTKEPELVYDETCTTLTVGIDVPKEWKHSETVTFTPSTGTAKTLTAKPGETKTVDFPASKGLTVKAVPADHPDQASSIAYKAPKDCTSATPSPSTSGPVLAITGSSSTPIAGGAVALVLLGGGAFFLARRRKMKFTA